MTEGEGGREEERLREIRRGRGGDEGRSGAIGTSGAIALQTLAEQMILCWCRTWTARDICPRDGDELLSVPACDLCIDRGGGAELLAGGAGPPPAGLTAR